MSATREEVNNFLREFKKIGCNGVKKTYKVEEELAKAGLTELDFHNEIAGLIYKDYCKGPEPDRDIPGDIWVFGKKIDKDEYYIKLKITLDKAHAVCISFHPPKYVLTYPLK